MVKMTRAFGITADQVLNIDRRLPVKSFVGEFWKPVQVE